MYPEDKLETLALVTMANPFDWNNQRLLVGWAFLIVGALIPWIVLGTPDFGDAVPALLLTFVFGTFFWLMIPILGSLGETRTSISVLVVVATFFLLVSQVLGNEGDWPIARVYQFVQEGILEKVFETVLGEDLAKFILSPLYLIIGVILLSSFAMRNPLGFYIIIALILGYGLFPFKPWLLVGVFLWCSGLCLVRRPHFHFSPALHDVLELDEEDERFLLELRDRPLPLNKAMFLLGHDPVETVPALPDKGRKAIVPIEVTDRLRKFSDADLIEYDASTGKIHASPALEESRVTPAATRFVDVCSAISTAVLLGLAIIYFAIPFDFIPEGLVGPVGLVDDLVLSGLALLPVGKRIKESLPGRKRKTQEKSASEDSFSS